MTNRIRAFELRNRHALPLQFASHFAHGSRGSHPRGSPDVLMSDRCTVRAINPLCGRYQTAQALFNMYVRFVRPELTFPTVHAGAVLTGEATPGCRAMADKCERSLESYHGLQRNRPEMATNKSPALHHQFALPAPYTGITRADINGTTCLQPAGQQRLGDAPV